jgi:hypothetical protein
VRVQRLLSVRIIIRLGQHLFQTASYFYGLFYVSINRLVRYMYKLLLSFVVGDGVNPLNNEKLFRKVKK